MSADGGAAPEGFSSAKREILLLLKRRPGRSLGEIADALGVTKVAVLRHVETLEQGGLIERSYRRGSVGRPRVQFTLSVGSARLFPHNYAEVSVCALEFIERRLGRPAVKELLQERAHEVADEHRAHLAQGDLRERVQKLVQIRTQGGYMAELGPRTRGTLELLEHNCPILALAERFPEACETERRMFESMLHTRVDVSHRVVQGDPVCRFRIRRAPGTK